MFKKSVQTFLIVSLLFVGMSPVLAVSTTIDFSGYTWSIRPNGTGNPGKNNWSAEKKSVFVDASGQLHLKIRKADDKWYSSSLHLNKSLGYGIYEYKLGSDINKQDFGTIIGLFLYQDDEHELDIELGKWTTSTKNNLHYSVQPYSVKGNSVGFPLVVNLTESSYVIDWQPTAIKFYVMSAGQKLVEWEYKGANNFVPGKESVHINFWQIKGQAPFSGQDQELIVKGFKFTPLAQQNVSVPKEEKKVASVEIKAKKQAEKKRIEKRIAELKKELTKLQAQLKKMK